MAQMLAADLKRAQRTPDAIFAVFPGGVMLGEWLSRAFLGNAEEPIPLRLVQVHTVRRAGGLARTIAAVKDSIDSVAYGLPRDARVLLVTDITRGGASADAAFEFLAGYFSSSNISTASLFCHKSSRFVPEFVVAHTRKDVVFDWKDPFFGE